MSTFTIFIIAFSILLVCSIFIMGVLSLKKKRMVRNKQAEETAYRKALEDARQREYKEKVFKADTGNASAQLYLAKQAEGIDLRESLYWYEKAAKNDNVIAMRSIVRLGNHVSATEEIRKKANFWGEAVEASEGDVEARYAVGVSLIKGQDVEQNIPKGVEYLESVAALNHLNAQLFIGDWHSAKSNPSPNPLKACEFYYQAASQGSTEAMMKLAQHYLHGKGVKKDKRRALYWYERAGELNDAEAQYYAAECYAETDETGNTLAYIWYFISAIFGYPSAAERRDHMSNLLGVESVIGLQSMLKPIIAKMQKKRISKHSIIKALDKIYERSSYFPEIEGNEFGIAPAKLPEAVPSQEESKKNETLINKVDAHVEDTIDFSQPITQSESDDPMQGNSK